MRWPHFFILLCLLVVIAGGVVYLHKDRVALMKLPPASLAKWYKPLNKRQVWLHNMFKLRREMQAVRFYSDKQNAKLLEKWVTRLSVNYLKIGEMVPEWENELDKEALARLQESAGNNRYQDVKRTLDELGESCESCHADYRAVSATMYRAPDFSILEVSPSVSFKKHMEELSKRLNAIKIASEDGMQDMAQLALAGLEKGMEELGKTCSTCHKKDTRVYPDVIIRKALAGLGESMKTGTVKDQGRELGTLAVLACARCHGTHRIAYGARKMLTDRPGWLELMRH